MGGTRGKQKETLQRQVRVLFFCTLARELEAVNVSLVSNHLDVCMVRGARVRVCVCHVSISTMSVNHTSHCQTAPILSTGCPGGFGQVA